MRLSFRVSLVLVGLRKLEERPRRADEAAVGARDERGAEDEEEEYTEMMSLYHLRTVFKNIKAIIRNHYPQVNLELVHGLDSYYTQGVPEEEEKPNQESSEKTPAAPTGDGERLHFWIGVMAVAVLGLAYSGTLKKEK